MHYYPRTFLYNQYRMVALVNHIELVTCTSREHGSKQRGPKQLAFQNASTIVSQRQCNYRNTLIFKKKRHWTMYTQTHRILVHIIMHPLQVVMRPHQISVGCCLEPIHGVWIYVATRSKCEISIHNFPRAMAVKVSQLPMTSIADIAWDKIQDSCSQESRVDDCTRTSVEEKSTHTIFSNQTYYGVWIMPCQAKIPNMFMRNHVIRNHIFILA